jgi:hypothetical protein
VAIAVGAVLTGVQTWRLQLERIKVAELRAQIQTERQQSAAAALQAQAEYRAVETAWVRKHQEIARDTQDQLRRNAAAAVDARVAGDGLRHRAAAVAARCAATAEAAAAPGSQATTEPGAVLSDVLGRLEAAGRHLAAVADARGAAGAACERAYDALRQP